MAGTCDKVVCMSFSHSVRAKVSTLASAEIAAYGLIALLALLLSKAG